VSECKRTVPKFVNVSSAGTGEHYVRLCPRCDTLCKIILRLFSTSKRKNGLYWRCGTLDCGFEKKVKLQKARA